MKKWRKLKRREESVKLSFKREKCRYLSGREDSENFSFQFSLRWYSLLFYFHYCSRSIHFVHSLFTITRGVRRNRKSEFCLRLCESNRSLIISGIAKLTKIADLAEFFQPYIASTPFCTELKFINCFPVIWKWDFIVLVFGKFYLFSTYCLSTGY